MAEYRLSYKGVSAVVESAGAELISFIPQNGREYIWQADPAVWPNHTPMLFPVCSATLNNTLRIDGVPYPLGKHGFTRKVPFELGRHGADFVELVYASNPETLRQYPFEFLLHVTHTIAEDGFSTTFLVENKSEKRMPLCIGGHPGFTCPLYEGEAFEDYQLVFEKPESGRNLTLSDGTCIDGEEQIPLQGGTILPLDHALFDQRDALVFEKLNSNVVKLVNAKTGRGFAFDFHKFDVLAVWTMPNKKGNYLCLEPWCGLPAVKGETGSFEDKPYVKFLNPGESFQVGYSMMVIE